MDFTQENVVSVWLGAGVPEASFAALLELRPEATADGEFPPSQFAEDFGIAWYDHDFLEACFEADNRPIATLLDGVSFGASFVEVVAELALRAGLPAANAAALLYDVSYVLDPDLVAASGPLRFVGAIPYEPTDIPNER